MNTFDQQLLKQINQSFSDNARHFIADFYQLEGKPQPDFSNFGNDEINNLYGECVRLIIDKLMWHRNKPVPVDYLNKLKKMSSLPKSPKIILDSINF